MTFWLPVAGPTKVLPKSLTSLQGSLASGREARSIGPVIPFCLDTLGLHDPPFTACNGFQGLLVSGSKVVPTVHGLTALVGIFGLPLVVAMDDRSTPVVTRPSAI
jgi:hypothetical protein